MEENTLATEIEEGEMDPVDLPLCGFSIPEVCRRLGNSGKSFVYQEIASGRLIARKASGRTLVLPRDLMAYLDNLPRTGRAKGQNGDDPTPDAPNNHAPDDEPGAQANDGSGPKEPKKRGRRVQHRQVEAVGPQAGA